MRAKIQGTAERPRLSVFRSNKHMFVQLIDDRKGKTLVSCSDAEVKPKKQSKKDAVSKTDAAFAVGEAIAEKARKADIEQVVFDRGGYGYQGRVKAVAEGARKGGLQF